MRKTVLFLTLLFTLSRCGDDNNNTNTDFDRTDLLINLSDYFVLPSLNDFLSALNSLDIQVDSFNNNPNQDNLNTLRNEHQNAYLVWQNSNIFEFGPAENNSFRANINTFPADVTNINSLISSGTYDLDILTNYDSKGLPALDYLLFGSANSDAEILALYNSHPDKEKYKQFLSDLSADMIEKTTAIVEAWMNGYQTDFKNNKTNDIGSSISLFINAYIFHYENQFRTLKIGIPVGVFSIEEMSFPNECEGLYSGNSVDLIIENFAQLEKIYFGNGSIGSNGIGIEEYLIGVNAQEANNAIKAQLIIINDVLNNLTNPLSVQVVNNRNSVIAVYTEIQKLLPLLKADMASALSIQITYTDTDGD